MNKNAFLGLPKAKKTTSLLSTGVVTFHSIKLSNNDHVSSYHYSYFVTPMIIETII